MKTWHVQRHFASAAAGTWLAKPDSVSDPSSHVLSQNLARLSPATQLALTAISGRPAVMLETIGGRLHAFVTTADGRRVQVHASADPLAASMGVVERLAASKPPLLIVVGLGLGYLLDAIEQQGLTTHVLAIEPLPAVTAAMLARRDWSSWLDSGRLTILLGPDYAGSTEAWGLFGRNPQSPPIIESPLLQREFPEEAARARELARQVVIGAKSNEAARRQFAGRYLLNTIANLPAIAAEGNASALLGLFPRVPCVVIGAGPSLDRNLPDLLKLDGKALFVAVDTAVRPLLAAGIRPHLVTAVDPSELNAQHLRGLADQRGMWLVAEGSIDPSVVSQFWRRLFTFKVSQHHPWPWLEGISGQRGRLKAWGSVLTTAFDLACQMGCDPIVFAGADLAYSNGLQYCRNTVYEPGWQHLPTDESRAEAFRYHWSAHPHLTLPDVRGEGVVTTPHFVQFRDWLVSRANEAADRRIVNATGGGILLGGRIGQSEFSVLHLPKSRHDLNLQRRIANAWAAGSSVRTRNLEDLERALHERLDLPLNAWLEFGGDTASREDLEGRLAVAGRQVGEARRMSAYLSASAAHIEQQADTLERARAFVHPNYELARTQARAHQAHVLLDYLQRTYTPPPGAQATDVVHAASTLPKHLRVLDVGCGLGRSMEPLAAAGYHVDGVDISQRMIELAQENPKFVASQFFLSDGLDCGRAEDGAYDLAYSFLSFHRIAARSARLRLLSAVARALRPGGVFVVQLPFFTEVAATAVPTPHVSWLADIEGDQLPSVHGLVWPTADHLPVMLADFDTCFHDVRFQIVDLRPGTRDAQGTRGRVSQILISGCTRADFGKRLYAATAAADTTARRPSGTEGRS